MKTRFFYALLVLALTLIAVRTAEADGGCRDRVTGQTVESGQTSPAYAQMGLTCVNGRWLYGKPVQSVPAPQSTYDWGGWQPPQQPQMPQTPWIQHPGPKGGTFYLNEQTQVACTVVTPDSSGRNEFIVRFNRDDTNLSGQRNWGNRFSPDPNIQVIVWEPGKVGIYSLALVNTDLRSVYISGGYWANLKIVRPNLTVYIPPAAVLGCEVTR